VTPEETVRADLEVRVLGPLDLRVDGERLELGGGRQRALLAMLVLHRGRVVSTDTLIDALWDGDPPGTARKALQNFVVQLRRVLEPAGDDLLATVPPGYSLRVGPEVVDAYRFERLAGEGRRLLSHDPARASEMLREALSLWHGDALAEFAYADFAAAEIARLDELRLGAIEDRIDADLAKGQSAELVSELEALVVQHPLRERLLGQLMLTLYRAGRQADALALYRDASSRMRSELGLEPGIRLRELELAILNQDPDLGGASGRVVTHRRRRGRLIGGVTVAVLVGGLVAGIIARGSDSSTPVAAPNSLVKIDVDANAVADVIPVGRDPGDVASVGKYVFVSSEDDSTLTRIDVTSGEVATSGAGGADAGLAGAGSRFVWVASRSQARVTRLNAESLIPIDSVPLPQGLLFAFVALGGGSLWTSAYPTSDVTRYSLRTLGIQRRYDFSFGEVPVEVDYGYGGAWVGLGASGAILRIDSMTGRSSQLKVGNTPSDPTVGYQSVWVAAAGDEKLWRVNALTGETEAIVDVGTVPFGVAVGAGSVWVSNNCDGTVSRIDPATNDVVATIEVGFFPKWLAASGGYVWVGVAAEPFDASRCGELPTLDSG
jgi:YVTN family beta-propeller protein